MKVLHLISEKSWRGGEQQAAYLMEELQRKGIEPHVACRTGTPFEAYCQDQNYSYISLPYRGSLDYKTIRSVKKYCIHHKMDIVHMHSAQAHALGVMAHWLGNPSVLILSRRVDFPIRNNFFTQWKYNYRGIHKILCVSRKIEEIVKSAIKNKNKCTTVYSGIDLKKFDTDTSTDYFRQTYHIPPETLLIGNTSALAGHKDYFTFVDTCKMLIKRGINARFFIMGEGPMRDEIQAYIRQNGLENEIVMTGFMKNIAEVLPEIDYFLMTSKTEGLGTSILDAFACRIPVVATNAGGIPEMVRHNETGLCYRVGDSEGLANGIEKLIRDQDLRSSLVKGASAWVKQFSKENMAENTLKIYREAVHQV